MSLKRSCRIGLVCLAGVHGMAGTNDVVMLGFTPEAASIERNLEIQFDSGVTKQNLRDWMKHRRSFTFQLTRPIWSVNMSAPAKLGLP